MILFFSNVKPDGFVPPTGFECPYCGKAMSFYSVSPRHCTGCGKSFLFELRKLMEDTDERMNFHRSLAKC